MSGAMFSLLQKIADEGLPENIDCPHCPGHSIVTDSSGNLVSCLVFAQHIANHRMGQPDCNKLRRSDNGRIGVCPFESGGKILHKG